VEYTKSATKHYSIEAIEEVLEFSIKQKEYRTGIIVYVGWYNGELLEVLVNVSPPKIFHCAKMTNHTARTLKIK
jgi:hypothetical protein